MVEGRNYLEQSVALAPDGTLFLYTDGVTEAFDGDGNQFGDARLTAVLQDSAESGPRDLLDRVAAQVRDFASGEEQSDDITCMAVRFKATGGSTADRSERVTISARD